MNKGKNTYRGKQETVLEVLENNKVKVSNGYGYIIIDKSYLERFAEYRPVTQHMKFWVKKLGIFTIIGLDQVDGRDQN